MGTRRKFLESLLPTNFLPRLPSAYQEVEYLESTGTQYIDTMWSPQSPNLSVKTKIYTDDVWDEQDIVSNQDDTSNRFVMGLYHNYVFGYTRSGAYTDQNAISSTFSGPQTLNIQYILDFDENLKTLIVDDVSYTAPYNYQGAPSTKNVRLFSGPTYFSRIKLYYFQCFDQNSILVRDFIPCYRKADGVAGLYDIVNGVFYTNAGTGTFICGRPVVSRVYQPVEYIESTGTQWIDTKVSMQNGGIIDAKAAFINPPSSGWMYLCGAESTTAGNRRNAFISGSRNAKFAVFYGTNIGIEDVGDVSSMPTAVCLIGGPNKKLDVYYGGNHATTPTASPSDIVDYPLFIFASNRNTEVITQSTGSCRLYSFKMYQSNTLVRDFVPCYRIADGVAGLLDKVHGVFYTNKGTGEFICGRPLIDPRYQRVEYIESTGTQYISTSISFASSNIGFDVKGAVKQSADSGLVWVYDSTGYLLICGRGWQGISLYIQNVYQHNSEYQKFENSDFNTHRFKSMTGTTNGTVDGNPPDGSQVADRVTTYDSPNLFLDIFRTVSGSIAKSALYSCKIYDSNMVIRDFVPCYRKSDGEIGLYDIVEGKFYTNSGTGTFLKGPNV